MIDDLKTSDHFEGRASTGSELFALLSDDFKKTFWANRPYNRKDS